MQDDHPNSGWRPKLGGRGIVVATNQAAKVTAVLLHDRLEVEPETGLNAVEPGAKYAVYSLSELREAYSPR